jgi:hypothetical protein
MRLKGKRGLLLGALASGFLGWGGLFASVPAPRTGDAPVPPAGLRAELEPPALLRAELEPPQRGVLHRVDPGVPRRIGRAMRGVVSVVTARVSADGRVREIVEVHSIGAGIDLNEWNVRVADAVMEWRFVPEARCAGGRATQRATVSIRVPPEGRRG